MDIRIPIGIDPCVWRWSLISWPNRLLDSRVCVYVYTYVYMCVCVGVGVCVCVPWRRVNQCTQV